MTIYNTPYTYLIGWTEQNKWYYGVRFAKKCHPNDLWTTYFTSSNYVKKFRKEYGEPDIVEVRKIFTCSQKARDWETKVIKRLNIVESDEWLNRTDNTNKFYHEGSRGNFSEEHKNKLSISHKGKKRGKSHPDAIKKLHEGRRKSKNSESHKQSIKEFQRKRINTGYYKTDEHRQKMSNARNKIDLEKRKELAKIAGKESAKKRKESGYYKSEEWKEICNRIWQKRRSKSPGV